MSMAIVKCKMCGGDIELSPDKTFGTCEFCGSTMTFPKVDDDQRAAAFNRGNHFRRIGEFDKALTVYERLASENPTDAEAHWCSALCRFGIEYVKDPASGVYIPTCHRTSFDSFLKDVDYLAAVEYADAAARRQYEQDAKGIEEVRRGILTLSQNEAPYDVFICYKESDDRGLRTVDSLRAQEIYYQLIDQGHRVFFARITLEDKAGQQYEPYIFAALNSAKVMLVVGTRREHLESVWVRNEWSRYLALIKRDRKKLLIPCYSEMDPYDMPEQLSVLQSYDMTKIGFIQDLTRGIAKVLDTDRTASSPVKESVAAHSEGSGNLTALLKRGNMALEDSEWQKADTFFEQVLNLDAECAEAYMGKVLSAAKCQTLEAFIQSRLASSSGAIMVAMDTPADTKHMESIAKKYAIPNYLTETDVINLYKYGLTYSSAVQTRKQQKNDEAAYWKNHKQLVRARQFATGNYKEELEGAYQSLMRVMDERIADAEQQEKEDGVRFLKEADEKAAQMYADAQAKREQDYQTACSRQESALSIMDYNKVIELFQYINSYKDSEERIAQCEEKLNRRQTAEDKRWRITCIVICIVVALIVAVAIMADIVSAPSNEYSNTVPLLNPGKYVKAAMTFTSLVS